MPSLIHKPFVSKILLVTLFTSIISTLVPRYRSDPKRSRGEGEAGEQSSPFMPIAFLVGGVPNPL